MVSANARHVSKGGKSANMDNVSMTSDRSVLANGSDGTGGSHPKSRRR